MLSTGWNQQTGLTTHSNFFLPWRNSPTGPRPPHYQRSANTLRHNTLCRTPLYEWSARHRDLYLTTYNNHKRQTSMPPEGFEPTVPTSDGLQTHALDSAATGIGTQNNTGVILLWRIGNWAIWINFIWIDMKNSDRMMKMKMFLY